MEIDLPIHKLIVDSRSAIAGNASEFQIQLPETLYMPQDSCAYVCDVCISHTFRSIEDHTAVAGRNHFMYFFEQTYQNGTKLVLNRAALASGHYTPSSLAQELENAMNTTSIFGAHYTATYHVNTNSILISLSYAHPIPIHQNSVGFGLVNKDVFADSDFQSFVSGRLEEGQQGTPYFVDFQNADDCCGILGLARNSSANVPWATLKAKLLNNSLSQTQSTGSVDVRHRTSLYLHSSALSNNKIIGPAGSRTVLCKVPVVSLPGGVCRKEHNSHIMDYIPTGGRTLSVLDFSVRDSFGDIVDLQGGHTSFEIIFSKSQPLI